jgi:hypothetical protein
MIIPRVFVNKTTQPAFLYGSGDFEGFNGIYKKKRFIKRVNI